MGLMKRTGLLNQGYSLYMDNYYSSPTLFDDLSAANTLAVATVRGNRKEVPKALSAKLQRGEVVYRQRETLLAMKWTDKRDVCLLSSKHLPTLTATQKRDHEGNIIVKPTCIVDYNAHMGGADLFDQKAKYYTMTRKISPFAQNLSSIRVIGYKNLISNVRVKFFL